MSIAATTLLHVCHGLCHTEVEQTNASANNDCNMNLLRTDKILEHAKAFGNSIAYCTAVQTGCVLAKQAGRYRQHSVSVHASSHWNGASEIDEV